MLKNHFYEGKIEAGCDEAGRGCLAGSVFAAAVILPDNYKNDMLNDSKQLTEKKRYLLREQIERDAVAWILAMHRALDQLKVRPEAIIVDGNKFKPYREPIGNEAKLSSFERKEGTPTPHTTIVKGDGKYLAIAAASILAKTYRDDYMNEIDAEYPAYQWKKNKGYPTKAHYAAIREVGPSPYHRLTFKGVVDTQLEIEFD